MMPGETHSKTAGIASEAVGSCQNCTSLQQSLNEYVAALITLKQKIIDSDHLLAEYQQKCDDLQYAERANETLRCQLEQIFQKISPQEQIEAELKSLRAELEEKTSSLKIFQQTHLEYVRVKEECKRNDIIKKKLEEKLKKMEEAAAKHVTKFKRLQFERKVTEKEFKKIQKRLNSVKKARSKKVMKNAQTQVANKEPVVMLDKQKIKLLLEELWGCIDSSPEESNTNYLMFGKHERKARHSLHSAECMLSPSNNVPEAISEEIDSFSELVPVQALYDPTKCTKFKRKPVSDAVVLRCNGDSTIYEDTTDVPKDLIDGNSENSDLENEIEDVQKVMNWAKPLPRLLSPLELSLMSTKQVFGELTDSSDAESCEGTHEIATNNTKDSATLDKILCCAQDETQSSVMQAGDLEKVIKCYNDLIEESDNIALCTDDVACPTATGSASKEDILCSDDVACPTATCSASKEDILCSDDVACPTATCSASKEDILCSDDVACPTATCSASKEDILCSDDVACPTATCSASKEDILCSDDVACPTATCSASKEDILCSDDVACPTATCSTSKEDSLCKSTKMGTNGEDTKQTELKTEVSDALVSSTLSVLKEVIKEHKQLEYEDTSDCLGNSTEGSNELSLLQTNPDLPAKMVVDLNKPKLERTNFPECNMTGNVNTNSGIALYTDSQLMDFEDSLATDQMQSSVDFSACCSLSVNLVNPDIPKEFTVDSINCHTKTSNTYKSNRCLFDNSSKTGDLPVNHFTADKNVLLSMCSTVTDCAQKSSPFIYSNELSISPSAKQNSTGDTGQSVINSTVGAGGKQPQHCFVNVHSEISVPIDSSINMEDSLEQLSSPSVIDITNMQTMESKQYVSKTENANPLPLRILKPPTQIQESVSILAASSLTTHHVDCIHIKEVSATSFIPTFHDDKEKLNDKSHDLDITIMEKENILSASPNNNESTSFYSEEVECGRKEDYLDKDLSQNERSLQRKYNEDMSLNIKLNKTANIDGQCKRTFPETVELHAVTSFHKPSSSFVVQKTSVTEMQADSSDVANVQSMTQVFFNDEQLCSSVQKSSPLELLHLDDESSTVICTTDAKRISSFVENLICHDISKSSMNNHIKVSVDLVTKNEDKDESVHKEEGQHMEPDDTSRCPGNIRDISMEPLLELHPDNSDKIKAQNSEKQIFSSGSTTELRNVDYCQEVTPKKELCSLVSQDKGVPCFLSNSNISRVKEREFKGTPEILLEEACNPTPLDPNTDLKKVIQESPDICHPSLDSSGSEEEVIMRKVIYSRTFSNKPIITVSCKINSSEIKKSNEIGHLKLGEPHSKDDGNSFSHDEYEKQVPLKLNPQNNCNSIEMEKVECLSNGHTVDPKNDTATKGSAVQQYSDEKDKNISPALLSDSIQSSIGKNIRNNDDTESHKCPGKNLIWNFNPDDLFEHRAESMNKRDKAKSEKASADSHNFVGRSSVNSEKTQILELSKMFSCNGFDFQGTRKESPSQRQFRSGTVLPNTQMEQTVLANADTSTNTDHSPETISKVRSEMGPPLPPLLGPLLATPPRSLRLLSPIMSSSSRSSLPSPLEDFVSPLPGTPFPRMMSPLCDSHKRKSPAFPSPSPVEKANRRILSSPLQFCSATPKHALPVPCRLPLSATGTSTPNVQENSVKILDSMYPELSARARTLNILKGNVQLSRGLPGDCNTVPVNQITGFKPITSTSTAFIKTGSNSKTNCCKDKLSSCESQQPTNSCASVNKRSASSFPMPKSAKRLRLDSESPFAESITFTPPEKKNLEAHKFNKPSKNISYPELLPDVVKDSNVDEEIIINALKKIEDLCFDLLPVIRSHVHVGTIPKVPVMRNEEKEVIYEFSSSKKGMADHFLHVVLRKLIRGKRSLDSSCIQALCRVYVGLCRQLGDIERARTLCYSILKEDFPEPDKLLLFIISSWSDLFSLHGVISKAIQAILKSIAEDDVGPCLSAYLNWEKVPPMNVSVILSSVLMAIQLYPDVNFCESQKYGEDLPDNVWEYVFAVALLCNHCKWIWTHDNVISKELWPVLDKWVKRKKGNCNIPFVPDIVVATVLRILGHLCQMGLKEGFVPAVKNIASVIVAFIQHADEEGMSWGVQLASVYMLCDLAPSDPAAIHQSLQTWREAAKNSIPPAIESYIQEVAAMNNQGK